MDAAEKVEKVECGILDECIEHDWEDITKESLLRQLGYRRLCKECGRRENWTVLEMPSPHKTPHLGKWEKAPNWRDVHLAFWEV